MNLKAKLNRNFIQSRKDRDTLKTNLLSTFKGQVESEKLGKNNKYDNDEKLIEAVAKSMIKSLKQVNTEDATKEIEILSEYVAQTLSEAEIEAELRNLPMDDQPNIGMKMRLAMTHLKGKAEGSLVKKVVTEKF